MWIEKQIDNLIEILGANEYSKMKIETKGDVTMNTTIEKPKFEYIKSQRQIKLYNSKDTVIINIWASSEITIDKEKLQYHIILECDECVTLKMYL